MHRKKSVLHRDKDRECPDNQGEDTHDILGRGGDKEKYCRQGIDRTCPDIAKDKSHRLDDS